MKCIIISDKLTGKALEEFIKKTSSVTLIGTFSNSVLAKNLLSERQDIDLLFLDTDALEIDSFDFITSLDFKPNIIMLSSGSMNALKAFDYSVIDYLLKPVSYPRFFRAVDKAIRYYSYKDASKSGDNEIFIRKGSKLIKLKPNDIIYIEALENYVSLHTADEKFTIHFTMKGIENQFPSGIFVRIHRSFIVNKTRIRAIKENEIELIVGETPRNLPLGKSFKAFLMNDITLMGR